MGTKMKLGFRQLAPTFAAEVTNGPGGIDLREVHDQGTLDALRAAMDQYGVLVFRNQSFTDADQIAFAQRLDAGLLGQKVWGADIVKKKLGDSPLRDISNVDENGEILKADDRRRGYQLSNRMWHTDASFRDPRGHYSLLSARVVPGVRADTEFADTRAAWDTLDSATRARIDGLHALHTIAWSRQQLGFEFSIEELDQMRGAVQPLVLDNPRTKRRALYLASHITRIMELPVAEGRLLLADLVAHATLPSLVYCHEWRKDDLVIWDNLTTMHRGRAFDDAKHKREMRRLTTVETTSATDSKTAIATGATA